MIDHPFVSGARVAIRDRFSDRVTEGFVDKVYKSGNFTLRGSAQQWRPWKNDYDRTWSAMETGNEYMKRRLDLWDDKTDAKISAAIETSKAKDRWQDLRRRIEKIREPDRALCDAIEAALSEYESKDSLARMKEAKSDPVSSQQSPVKPMNTEQVR